MKQKTYASATEFERQTSYCPLYLAWHVVDEARDYFRTEFIPSSGSATFSHRMGEGLAHKLARRAEIVFAKQPYWQRRFKSVRGRAAILTAMRHWLAGILARENPVLFRQLPETFKIGHPLPPFPGRSRRLVARRSETPATDARHLVHGCELLVV